VRRAVVKMMRRPEQPFAVLEWGAAVDPVEVPADGALAATCGIG
jgi:hypothetical protein